MYVRGTKKGRSRQEGEAVDGGDREENEIGEIFPPSLFLIAGFGR